LLTVPAFRLLWTHHDDLNQHVTRYTASNFRQLAERCGMRLDELRYFYHWLFPLKLAVRLKEACLAPRSAPPAVPAEPLNRLCYRLARWEHSLFRRHPLPFGSSLLAVGKAVTRAATRSPALPVVDLPSYVAGSGAAMTE
jgi:hypothetical protein